MMYNNKPTVKEIEMELNRVRVKSNFINTILRKLLYISIVLYIVIITFTSFIGVVLVDGNSMSPTLDNGDVLLSFKTNNVGFGDIVTFEYDDKVLLKRVIGLEDEIIDMDSDYVYINGQVLNEPYILTKNTNHSINISLPHKINKDSYFLLGDNRTNSIDSRFEEIGDVLKYNITSKVVFRIWPFRSIGFVN